MANLPDLSGLFNLRPERAADYLAAKGLRLSGPYWELDGPQHSRVFTVANLAKLDVLTDIRDAVQGAIDEGKTERWFRAELVDTLRRKGWWGPAVQVDPITQEARIIQQGSLRRLQTIYRTNLQTSYMAGRHRQAEEQAARAPFAQYLAVRDSRTRPSHSALHGRVFRLDSPEWAVISPPNGYNCRCRARYLSQAELDERGLKVETDTSLIEQTPERVPVDPLTGETPARVIRRGVRVPNRDGHGYQTLMADLGWDHLPGSDGSERALVDRLMEKAADLGGGVRELVLADLGVAPVVRPVAPVALPMAPTPDSVPQKRLMTQLREADPLEREDIATDYIRAHRKRRATAVKAGSMPDAEQLYSVKVDGINYHYKGDGTLSEMHVAALLRELAEKPLPRRLTKHTRRVIFAEQANMRDAYWAQQYNMPGFTSLATGGSGDLVVYRGQSIDAHDFAHEAAHAFAKGKYGNTMPPPSSEFARAAASGELAPDGYARDSGDIGEDFAESVRWFFLLPAAARAQIPRRYAIIKRLMEDDNYGG